MSRKTYTWLTTSLIALSAILLVGSVLALQTDWLQAADFLVQFAVCPGGLIAVDSSVPVAAATPRRPHKCRSAKNRKHRAKAKSLARYGGRPAPRLCDIMSVFDLAAYCFQVEMIRDRLVGQAPLDGEPFTAV